MADLNSAAGLPRHNWRTSALMAWIWTRICFLRSESGSRARAGASRAGVRPNPRRGDRPGRLSNDPRSGQSGLLRVRLPPEQAPPTHLARTPHRQIVLPGSVARECVRHVISHRRHMSRTLRSINVAERCSVRASHCCRRAQPSKLDLRQVDAACHRNIESPNKVSSTLGERDACIVVAALRLPASLLGTQTLRRMLPLA